jgi:hypothetical protein
MKEIWHIIYTSIANSKFENKDLIHLLEQSRRNNEKLDITGVLLYDGNVFFQVLEGEEANISEIYNRICNDNRSRSIKLISKRRINARRFPNWTMGFKKVTKKELNEIKGINNFFTDHKFLYDVNPEIADIIAKSFLLKE